MEISSNWSGFIELVRLLTHLMSLVKRFLMFSGGTEIVQRHEMGNQLLSSLVCSKFNSPDIGCEV